MAKIKDDVKIGGNFTVGDWKKLREKLLSNLDNINTCRDDWNRAIEVFDSRVKSRFLNPIEAIKSSGKEEGEGFSMVALLCILMEFFEAFYQGLIYFPGLGYSVKGNASSEDLRPNEYRSSRQLFMDFLTTHPPFKSFFSSRTLAGKFFDSIRCGLLHEAVTKKNWVIRADSDGSKLFEETKGSNSSKEMVVYRNELHKELLKYLEDYKRELLGEGKERRTNFVRKIDDICQI